MVEQGVVDQGRRGVGDAACRGGGGYSGQSMGEDIAGRGHSSEGTEQGCGGQSTG